MHKQWPLRFLASLTALFLLLGALPGIPVSAKDSTRSAKIESITGEVHIRRGGDKELAAFEGMRLQEGDTLLTGLNSSAEIQIDDDKTVSVDENTEITLDALTGDAKKNKTSISVFIGNIINAIKNKLLGGSTYETRTSTTVMGVRGTTYFVGQAPGEVRLIVSDGTVAVSEAAAEGNEEASEPVPVPFGNELKRFPQASGGEVVPVASETLLSLTPSAAKALVTDELLNALSDPSETFSNVDALVRVLDQKASERSAKEAQRVESITKSLVQRQEEEANLETFFDLPQEKLTGSVTAQLLLSPPSGKTEEPLPAKQEAKREQPKNNSAEKPSAPAKDESKQPEQPPASGSSKPSGDSSQGNKDNGSGNKPPEQPDKTPEKPGDNQGGSNDQSKPKPDPEPDPEETPDPSPNPDPTPTPKPDPEPPAITMGALTLDTVYTTEAEQKLLALTVTWDKLPNADDYTIEICHGRKAYKPLELPERAILQSDTAVRILIPASHQEALQGASLRVTPKIQETTVVSAETILDFTIPSSGSIKRLSSPSHDFSLVTSRDEPWKLLIPRVAQATSYQVFVYQNGELFKTYNVLDPTDASLMAAVCQIEDALSCPSVSFKTIAVGDQFNLLSSLPTDFQVELNQLSAPLAEMSCQGQGVNFLLWEAVPDACGYVIEAVYAERTDRITGEFTFQENDSTFIFYLFPNWSSEKPDSLRIKAVSNRSDILDSPWYTVVLPEPDTVLP